ncbi:MAG: class C sortase [Lachnospiraceae bacterium]|nr:class C sortase [Lachnospiraceae bacterium]
MNKWLRSKIITIILFAIMLVGAGLMLYPSAANWWNSLTQTGYVASYMSEVASMDKSEYEKILNEAIEYNKKLSETGLNFDMTEEEMEEYNRVLNVSGSGVMGYIDIPKINETLPVYHNTEDTILRIAVGHIVGTSLPVGGESSHCVVSGHRGLPTAKLFTDIVKLVEGDTWTLNVLDQVLTYEVDQIRVVEPSNMKYIQIEKGKDYCTLVTCTPYGINSHRILIRGHRIPNVQANLRVTADAMIIDKIYVAPFVAAPILIILLIMMLVTTRKKPHVKRKTLRV